MRSKRFILRILTIILGMGIWSCSNKPKAALTIAASANMQYPVQALINSFEKEKGVRCELVTASSGKLMAQIQEGAPYHLFLSADLKYPQQLFDAGFCTQEPKVYAKGRLVLWSLKDISQVNLEEIILSDFKHLAIANPSVAPYGMAAAEVLEHTGLFDSVKTRLVYGQSLNQVNQFIETGAADMGFTAMSTVLAPQLKNRGHWREVPQNHYRPILQGVVSLKKTGGKSEIAQQFKSFLFSEEGQAILKDYGYIVNE